jgi:DNA-binding NtrC family response regulator
MQQPRVLLVEDNRVLRWWLKTGLEKAGFNVVPAESASEAEWLSCCFPFHVLITDWHLADGHNGNDGHDGFEVLAHVRGKQPKLLAVLISADADAELAERAWKAGFHLVLQKPLRLPEIIGAVYCLIGERGLEVSHEAA